METHFEQEDELYYPAIWVLRPSEKPELLGFVEAHQHFRTRLREIEAHLDREALDEAFRAFAHLAETFAAHEVAEERLLRDLDRQLAPRTDGG